MTESDQTAALKSAFPTEPVPERLKTRIENLTPLPPTVTGYRFKFRHALAAFAVLWIGHNVPTAIWSAKASNFKIMHTKQWKITNGQKILRLEAWSNRNVMRVHYLPIPGVQEERIEITKTGIKLRYEPHRNMIIKINTNYNPFSYIGGSRTSSYILTYIPILLLRTHDTRINGSLNERPVKIITISDSTLYIDPLTERQIGWQYQDNYAEADYDTYVPDSFFEPQFPQDAKVTEKSEYIDYNSGTPWYEVWKNWLTMYLNNPHA